jgi:5'-nucleotidase/UDP-sugar diphosphatase
LAGFLQVQTDTLTVIHINGTHSHLVPYGPKNAQGVGDPMFNKYLGVPELGILATLGCDAMTLGNHEFDLYPTNLVGVLGAAGFPIPGFDLLSGNIEMHLDPALDALVEPWVIKDVGDLKVGIFGLTTEETNAFSNPAPDSITSCVDGAVAAVTALAPSCDIIMGLTHLGYEVDCFIAANVPGIDLIVGGHSHTALHDAVAVTNPLGGITWVVQAGMFYDYVGCLKVAKTGALGVEVIDYELIPVTDAVTEEPTTAAVVQTLVAGIEADPLYGPIYSATIAEATVDMGENIGSLYKDTPIGNLITDAFRDETGTDIAMTVDGFISQGLYAGDLCGFDIFETVPYGYDEYGSGYGFGVSRFELSGLELFGGLETILEMASDMGDLNVQVSGMTMEYESDQPLYGKINSIMIGGEFIQLGDMYSVTTNSGLAGFLGLAGLTPTNLTDTGLMEYEVVHDYIVANSPVNYAVEGRIEDVAGGTPVEEITAVQVPEEFALSQNYPNPFNPETTGNFTVPKTSQVSVSVYNMLGQKVALLLDSRLEAGSHTAQWDASNMSAGIYFCRLKAGETKLTRRMVLVK